jgi:hypothetical protein
MVQLDVATTPDGTAPPGVVALANLRLPIGFDLLDQGRRQWDIVQARCQILAVLKRPLEEPQCVVAVIGYASAPGAFVMTK